MSVSADPRQRYIFMALPFIFIPFILSFPAGLLVYWITTNLWTIVQQFIVRRTVGPVKPVTAGADAKAADDGGGGLLARLTGGGGGEVERDATGRAVGGAEANRPKAKGGDGNGTKPTRRSAPPPPPRRNKKKKTGRRR